MFESNRFGWQKLTLNNVFYKGGGGGGGAAAPTPPPDYSPQWNDVVKKSNQAIDIMNQVGQDVQKIGSAVDWQSQQAAANAKIDNAVSLIDNALATNATIPAEWFGRADKDRQGGISVLNQCRANLLALRDQRKPNQYEVLSTQVNTMIGKLYAAGRYLSAPSLPLPSDLLWFPGSWMYDLYLKGYTPREITWAIDYSAANNLQEKYGNDELVFKLQVELAIDNAILNNEFRPTGLGDMTGLEENITNIPVSIGKNSLPPVIIPPEVKPGGYYPTGPVIGIGVYRGGSWASYSDSVYAEDGGQYLNPTVVPFGLRYSKSIWEYRQPSVQPAVEPIQIPQIPGPSVTAGPTLSLPPGMRKGTPAYSLWVKRQLRTRGAIWQAPSLAVEPPMLGFGSTTIDNNSNNSNNLYCGVMHDFDHELVGAGYDLPTIHTTRLAMKRAKLKPRANRGRTALQMGLAVEKITPPLFCNQMQAQQEIDAINVNLIEKGGFNTLDHHLNSIEGVTSTPFGSSIGRMKALARRSSNRVRRGMIPAANMETAGDGGNNSGGSNN